MSKVSRWFFLALLGCGASGAAGARPETPQTATIAEKTAGAQKLPGYFNLYWDARQGKLWLEIDKWGTEFLYRAGFPRASVRMTLDWTAASLARRVSCASSVAAQRS